jgi:hypothetical protein
MADLSSIIEDAAKRNNVDVRLINGVIGKESSGNAQAINKAGGGQGAYGVMQVRAPALADYNAAKGTKYTMQDLLKPDVGVDVGTWYLSKQLDKFNDPGKALVAYNQGAGSSQVANGANHPYAKSVLSSMSQPKNLPGIPESASPDADAIFTQRFGSAVGSAAPAKSADPAEQLFAQRFGSALASAPAGRPSGGTSAAVTPQVTREWAQKNPAEFQKMLEAGKISPEQWQAITGSTGSAGAGIRDVVSGIVQRGAHTLGAVANAVAPNSDLAKTLNAGNPTLDKQVGQQEQAYQAARQQAMPPTLSGLITGERQAPGIDWGRMVTGAVPSLVMNGGPVKNFGDLVINSLALGGSQGLMTPVTSGDYATESAKNVGINTLVGGAVPVVGKALYAGGKYIGDVGRSLVAPFTEKGQKEIAANIVNRFASKGAPAQATGELVKGSAPILAESSGNAGVGALTRGLASANPEFGNQLAMRAAESNAARINALQGIAGNAETRTAAEVARDQAVKPLYDAATAQAAPMDSALQKLLQRPSVQKALSRAQAIAAERGQPFSLSEESPIWRTITNLKEAPAIGKPPIEVPSRTVTNTITQEGKAGTIAGAGAATSSVPSRTLESTRTIAGTSAGEGVAKRGVYYPEQTLSSTRTINARGGVAGEGVAKLTPEVSGNDLQTLKMAMDDLLADPASGIAGSEAKAVRDTRNAFVNWMESKIPDFKAARETYSDMSKPIARMDIANRLMQKYSSAVTDLSGTPKLRAESYLRALQDESKLLKTSGAFKGYRGLKDVFTPEELATIKNVGKDLNRAAVGQNAGRPVGSNTFQNLATSNMLQAAIPGRIGQFVAGAGPGTIGSAVGSGLGFAAGGLPGAVVGGAVGSRVGNFTNQLMATQNEAILGHLGNMLLSGQMPVSPAAAAARNINPALRYLSPAVIGLSRQSMVQPQ